MTMPDYRMTGRFLLLQLLKPDLHCALIPRSCVPLPKRLGEILTECPHAAVTYRFLSQIVYEHHVIGHVTAHHGELFAIARPGKSEYMVGVKIGQLLWWVAVNRKA